MNTDAKDRVWKIENADDLSYEISAELSKFLQSFQSSGGAVLWSQKYFFWKIKHNKVGNGFVDLALSENKIISSVSVTPKSFWYRGEKLKAAEIGDTYTDANFQRRGIFSALINDIKNRAHTNGYQFIYGVPNDQSRPGYEKNCNFVSHKGLKLSLGTYLHDPRILLLDRKTIYRKLLVRLIFFLVNQVQSFFRFFWVLVRKLSGISIREVTSIDASYDGLWETCKKQNDALLIRDSDYLRFRFFEHPLAQYHFYEAKKGGVLIGYLVSRVSQVRGRKQAYIVDWLYDQNHIIAFISLLHHALQKGISEGVEFFSGWVSDSLKNKLLFIFCGFIMRKNQPVIVHRNDFGSEILKSKNRWHFTMADSDNV